MKKEKIGERKGERKSKREERMRGKGEEECQDIG